MLKNAGQHGAGGALAIGSRHDGGVVALVRAAQFHQDPGDGLQAELQPVQLLTQVGKVFQAFVVVHGSW